MFFLKIFIAAGCASICWRSGRVMSNIIETLPKKTWKKENLEKKIWKKTWQIRLKSKIEKENFKKKTWKRKHYWDVGKDLKENSTNWRQYH